MDTQPQESPSANGDTPNTNMVVSKSLSFDEMSNVLGQCFNVLGTLTVNVIQAESILKVRQAIGLVNNSILALKEKVN